MGREAKYRTLSERAAAAAIHRQRYNSSERGRTRRSAQNSKTYQQSHPSITTSTLPNTLIAYSKAFLRKTPLFDLYYQAIDTDPFEFDLFNYTHLSSSTYEKSNSQQILLDLLHAINGRQLNLLQAAGESRYEESVNGFRDVTETARDNLSHMLHAWCCVESHPRPDDGTTAGLVYELSLEWGARAIVGLSTELEVRREGFLKYQSEYQGRKLWWQKIKVY